MDNTTHTDLISTGIAKSQGGMASINLKAFDDGPRALDLDIAKRLGFKRPRVIRELIKRNMGELERFGSLAAQRGKSRGQDFVEYWLNEEQALLIAAFSRIPKSAPGMACPSSSLCGPPVLSIFSVLIWRRTRDGYSRFTPFFCPGRSFCGRGAYCSVCDEGRKAGDDARRTH